MRTPWLFVRAYLLRASIVWLTMRLVVSGVLLFGQANPLAMPLTGIGMLVATSVGLLLFDTTRRHEQVLIADLAIGRGVLGALASIPALAGEIALRAAYALFS